MKSTHMTKYLQNKKLIGGICVALAAIIAFFVLPVIYKGKNKTTTICSLTTNVSAGELITDNMVTTVEVGSYGLPSKVAKDKSNIIGKYAKASISKDDLLFVEKFAEYISDETLDNLMSEDKRLVSITVSTNAASVANHLSKGDLVTIAYFNTATVGQEAYVEIDPDLKSIQIYSIENSKTVDVTETDDKDERIPSTVTLIVTEQQAQKLILAEYSGKLHVIFEKRGVSNDL